MIAWPLAALVALPLVLLMAASARGAKCNYDRMRQGRRTPPLHGWDVSAATVRPIQPPDSWPRIDDVEDAPTAAAYASLADDRVVGSILAGELLLVFGGALLGARVQHMFEGWWNGLFTSAVFVCALAGVVFRARATRLWEPVAARYRARYAFLTAQPAPPPEPPRPAGLLGLFRRR